MKSKLLLTTVLLGWLPWPVTAAVIDVDSLVLLPNTPNQQVMFFVSGTEEVVGFEFILQVGDRVGPNLPKITNVDLTTGTIFQGLPGLGEEEVAAEDFGWIQTVDWNLNAPLTLGVNDKIATVTFDTTGLNGPLAAELRLTDIPGDGGVLLDTFFLGPGDGGGPAIEIKPEISPEITSGGITVSAIPEPASLTLLALTGAAALGASPLRRRLRNGK